VHFPSAAVENPAANAFHFWRQKAFRPAKWIEGRPPHAQREQK
jgi:hypothetical protein